MPGWYVHMEAARQTVLSLERGELPHGLPDGLAPHADALRELGKVCHTWRNYVALGALGPDLFYLLPDFKGDQGCVIRAVVDWVVEEWQQADATFLGAWEKWVDPITTNAQSVADLATGSFQTDVTNAMRIVVASIASAVEGLLTDLGDWFGILTSGVPQGYGDNAFYWSDVFHYRRTYQFPYHLFCRARAALEAADGEVNARQNAETLMAFAVGWMTHCATDVTGHPFTNAKSGGPYRNHWQRHHLVENHMDSQNYSFTHDPGLRYGQYGLSALHFWVAFRVRHDAPYNGRADAPAYDYISGALADYPVGPLPWQLTERKATFDLSTGPLPGHLVDALHATMSAVHPDGPEILKHAPGHPAAEGSTGQPNAAALGTMWELVYRYLKFSGSNALSPQKPNPPDLIPDLVAQFHLPIPPGWGGLGPFSDDPPRGDDSDDDDLDLLDLLLAVLTWSLYIGVQLPAWLAAASVGVMADPAAVGARVAYHYLVALPLWDLYRMTRRALVMAGFVVPEPDEVEHSLTTLGTDGDTFDLHALLAQPVPGVPDPIAGREPSGRADPNDATGLDKAYPRGIVRDRDQDIDKPDLVGGLGLTNPIRYAGDTATYYASEWLAPWKYPLHNHAQRPVAQEGPFAHAGPYVAGQPSTVLLSGEAGSQEARTSLEEATTPEETATALRYLLARNEHLGTPVEYSRYLVARMLRGAQDGDVDFEVPDFNLDSDRGYAWHCWDWKRGPEDCDARLAEFDPPTSPGPHYPYRQPCTSPQLFALDDRPPGSIAGSYDERLDLQTHYRHREPAKEALDPDAHCDLDPAPPHEPYADPEWWG